MRKSFAVRRMLFAVSCGALLTVGSAQAAQGGTVAVTNTNDGLAGSLRQALQDASPDDTIVFQIPTSSPGYNPTTGIYTIGLTSGELVISKNLTIDPTGQKIWVQRTSGNFRIFNVTSGQVTILALTIRNGSYSATIINGGGILNAGNLTVRNCTFVGNDGGPVSGGAIHNTGTLRVSNCTFNGNAAGAVGSAIANLGDLTLENSTIVGNTAPAPSSDGAAVYGSSAAATRVRNTIIVGNTRGAVARDVSGPFISEGYNLIGSTTGSTGFGSTGDQLGATLAAANLTSLRDNGGTTQTMRPMLGSVAIDQGKRGLDANNQPINNDQRGSPRPVELAGIPNAIGGDGSDIGAVETGLPQTGPTFTVTNTADRATGSCTDDDCSLRDALDLSNAAGDANVIKFASGLIGMITNGSFAGGLTISSPLTINGPGARLLSISGNVANRVFFVASSNVVISGLTITLGGAPSVILNGGGIINANGGSLTLRDSVISECVANGENGGAGILNNTGATLVMTGCTLTSNITNHAGGGVFNLGTFTATNCTFNANFALNGGAIISKANNGLSSTTLRNCTITHNSVSDTNQGGGSGGGGVYAEGNNAQFHIANTIIAGNTSQGTNPDIRGNVTSDGFNFIGIVGAASGLTNGVNGDQVGSGAGINPNLDVLIRDNGGPTNTVALISPSSAINAGNDALAPATDQRGYLRSGTSDIGAFEFGGLVPSPVVLANISTRMRVETGDNVLIGGFIVTGTQPKKVIVRATGPSLPVPGKLENPTLELHGPAGLITSNDNWQDAPNRQEVIDSTLQPANDLESAILTTLPANSTGYTAIVRGASGGTGVGLVEVYDLDRTVDSKLANIASRGFVQTGDDVMIGGFIVLGMGTQRVIVRAIGPSLPVPGALADPTLELFNSNGVVIASNDNWRTDQEAEIIATTLPPTNDLESAIVATLPATAHTAIVRG